MLYQNNAKQVEAETEGVVNLYFAIVTDKRDIKY